MPLRFPSIQRIAHAMATGSPIYSGLKKKPGKIINTTLRKTDNV